MDDLKKTKTLIHAILKKKPETRNNDDLLYLEVISHFLPDNGFRSTATMVVSVSYIFLNRKTLGIPSFETVSRCRRKVQELHPELKAMDPVEIARMEQEKEFRSFALGVKS